MQPEVMNKDQVLELVGSDSKVKNFVTELGDRDSSIVANGGVNLRYRKKDYILSDLAMSSLVKLSDLPVGLVHSLSGYPDLLAHNLNYMIDHKNIAVRISTLGGVVLALSNPENLILHNEEVLDILSDKIKDVGFDKVYESPPGVFHFHAFTNNGSQIAVRKDDYFKHGVKVVNSPFGISQPIVSAYAVRLACLNGAIATDDIWKAPIKYESNWLPDAIEKATKLSTKFIHGLKNLVDIKLDESHLSELLVSIYEDLEVPEKVREFITNRVLKHGAANVYDIFNHMTYVGSHYRIMRDNPKLITRLMSAAGSLTNHASVCPNCYRVQSIH